MYARSCVARRISYTLRSVQPCITGGLSGVSVWQNQCTSDARWDAASRSCVPSRQNEWCDPDPISQTPCIPSGVYIPETDFPWPVN